MNQFLQRCEEYIARHEPENTVENLFTECEWVLQTHREFERHLRKHRVNIVMAQKKEENIFYRTVFIEWYVEKHQNEKSVRQMISELTKLTFSSPSTITNSLYNYRTVPGMKPSRSK